MISIQNPDMRVLSLRAPINMVYRQLEHVSNKNYFGAVDENWFRYFEPSNIINFREGVTD